MSHALNITVTDNAVDHFKRLMQKHPSALGVRLGLVKGGCSGLEYDWRMMEPAMDSTDTQIKACHEVNLYIETSALPLLTGSVIDCQTSALNQRQVVVQNPNAAHQCGCGISFGVETSVIGEAIDDA